MDIPRITTSPYYKLPFAVDRVIGRSDRREKAPRFPTASERLLQPFRRSRPLDAAGYTGLFSYFAEGWESYRGRHGASASYPGLPSRAGRWMDEIEGFTRLMPLFGAWVHSKREPRVTLAGGEVIDLPEVFRAGLLAGTDPGSPVYWGRMRDRNQRIVEAADVALSLWLFRNEVWNTLSARERERVARWLLQVNARKVHDSNWHLFVVLVNVALTALGYPASPFAAHAHYDRFREFYRGNGWFSDGLDDRFDYYNAWAIHYSLSWIRIMDPEWDAAFLERAQGEFVGSYKYLFGPHGFPILGRSVCYRTAAPAPLVFGSVQNREQVSPGEARRALDVVWRYFIQSGAVRRGVLTQGYHGADERLLDNYSGPASCLWGLRSLVAAFAQPEGAPFWSGAAEPLPVEKADFNFTIPANRWTVTGTRSNGVVAIELPEGEAEVPLKPHRRGQKMRGGLLGPRRPRNMLAKYGRREYRSDLPFCCDAGDGSKRGEDGGVAR